ncbi:MAG: metallophosphoesterase [Oscillospiraceae bacterium]|nr:metallophosphoesterase [Oscillospiraceae bacterium]
MKTKGKKHRGRGCLTALIILALIAAAAAFLIKDSRDDLEISRYEVKSQKLPESFDGFKIVQLSDLHGAEFGEDGMGLVEKVEELEPDIIALTGDFVTDEGDLAAVEKLAARLTELCPVYFVSGNHEFGSGLAVKVRNILERAGVKYLSNEYLTISRGEDEILLGGVEDPLAYADMLSPDELAQKMNDAAPDAFKILLGHRNYWMTEYPELPVDLIFCGHAHGGLIRIPGVGGLIGTDRRLFPDFDAGQFNNGRYTLIVSRGLGNSVSIPRVFNRPEIVCVELTRAYARA